MNPLLLVMIVFAAAFTQSFTGFGLSLVAMPLLTRMVSIRTASAFLSPVAITAQALLLLRYRQTVNLRAIGPLLTTSWIGVWLGIVGLQHVHEGIVTALLGIVIVGYALYALFTPRLPEIKDRRWAYLFGFLGGILSGAYNASGPPVVIYGTCRHWEPIEFKSNLQVFFLFNTFLVNVIRILNRDYTAQTLQGYFIVLPALVIGLLAGSSLDRWLNPTVFRKIVLWLLIALGVQLIF